MKTNKAEKKLSVWRRLVPENLADAWVERVAYIGPGRAVLVGMPGRKSSRLEVYCDLKSEAESLRIRFGGEVRQVPGNAWWLKQERSFFMKAGRRFCVASGVDAIPDKSAHLPRLLIPAGLAFGTGEHATTAMCLRQLEAYAPQGSWKMMDVGTGSGLLALAAALMGAKVFAFDFDADAIEESRKNAARNPQVGKIRWKKASIENEVLGGPYDVIVANLYSDLLKKGIPRMKPVLHPGGTLILSGILRTQESDVMSEVKRNRLVLKKRLRTGKWICLVLGR